MRAEQATATAFDTARLPGHRVRLHPPGDQLGPRAQCPRRHHHAGRPPAHRPVAPPVTKQGTVGCEPCSSDVRLQNSNSGKSGCNRVRIRRTVTLFTAMTDAAPSTRVADPPTEQLALELLDRALANGGVAERMHVGECVEAWNGGGRHPRRLMRAAKPAFKLSSSASSSVAWTVLVLIQRRCEPFHLERRDADAHEHRRLRQSWCRISSSERFAKRLHLLASYSAIGIVRYKIPILDIVSRPPASSSV